MKILIVDDNKNDLYLLKIILKGSGYEVASAANGAEALEKLRAKGFGMIISDILMPVMDGFQLCRECKGDEELKNIPFVLCTADYTSDEDEKFALSLEVNTFIHKPVEPDTFVQIIEEVFKKAKSGLLRPPEVAPHELSLYLTEYSKRIVAKLEDKVAQLEIEIAEREQAEAELQQSFERLRRAMEETIQAIALIAEMKDPYTAGHQRRVAQLACAIAKEIHLSEEQIEGSRMVGLIHDIGKISIPAEILTKTGLLTKNEFNLFKTHSKVGYDILKIIEFPWPIAKIVLQHHERMNGSGYPSGLLGEHILLEARILGVADVVEAMALQRPYRPSLGIDRSLEEISQNRDVLYDPEVVDACLKLFNEKRFQFE